MRRMAGIFALNSILRTLEALSPQKSTVVVMKVPLMKKLVVQSWINSVGMASVKRLRNAISIMKHLVVIFRWI